MKNKISFYVVLVIEILAIGLAVFGILPREIVLISTGIMVFYFIFSPIKDSLILFIVSIPLWVALPITESFDTMANWRILLVILFLVWFFKRKWSEIKISNLLKLTVVFFIIALLSLCVATNQMVGIKKILFLINIFLLFPIIQDMVKDEKQKLIIIKAGATSGIISLIIAYSQLISVFFSPLYNFWQRWASNVIPIFYGNNLSELLKVSNTWFSYYPDSLPTLRMFSVFPDSHSFALFTIIGLIFFSYLLISKYKNRLITWLIIVFSFLALLSSGSRGVWLSAVIPFLAVIYLLIFKKEKILKPFIIMLIIFALSFPVSSLILSQSRQDGQDATLAFKRAKSITDLEELSVKSRIGIWKTSFQSILKYPILGVGIGNYPVVLGEDISAGKKGASAHNLYLDVASEMGLLGLIALLLIFLEILKKSWKKRKEIYFLIFTFFFVWILIYNLFDVVLLNDKVLLLFMVALGLLYSKTYEKISISKYFNL
jgi:O-antigen ligase